MQVIPRLDMAGGESRFSLANPDDPERPLEAVADVGLRLQELGARRLQVIDVDRATEAGDNDDVLVDLLDRVGVPVEAGGGVRSMRRIQELIDTGVARVVLSTMGLEHLDWLQEVATCFGDRVVLAIDVLGGSIRLKGRTEESPLVLGDLARRLDAFGLGAVLVNSCDESPPAGAVESYGYMAARNKTPVWIGGAAFSLATLDALASTRVAGVVLGKEIYDGRLDAGEGFKRSRPPS